MIDRNRSEAEFTLDPPADRDFRRGGTAELVDSLRDFLGRDLGRVERTIEQSISGDPRYSASFRQAGAMGGKRLRPMLVLLSARATTESINVRHQQELAQIAASVELVHAASLVHDDVLDEADMRRHQPTARAKLGNRRAILLGDYLFTRAYALAAQCRSTLPARQIAAAASSLCIGELSQGDASGDWTISQANYRRMLVQKTGSLCGTACRLGAWLVGADRQLQRSVGRFGVLLGLAFQIYDDWLDYWGEAPHVGKTLGTDLKQAKATLPILRYLSEASPEACGELREILDSPAPDQFDRVLAVLNTSDAEQYTLETAKRLSDRAASMLRILPDTEAKQFLVALSHYATNRSR
ncbi:MAG TPA: polyprenyl synthetase family protein [Planctomycetaceae bacterium]|nr:polyprenyl synthetase family protein [Planctomycetaceae bacterium]